MNAGPVVIRLSKIVITAGSAQRALLFTLGNLTDYESNRAFVQHVLAMDTILPGPTLTWRAITNPAIQTGAYIAIIVTEALTCLLFLIAAVWMSAKLKAPKEEFHHAKAFTTVGVLLGFGLSSTPRRSLLVTPSVAYL